MASPAKEKPLTIDKAAFLLLRVRRVLKKKIQLKKEKNAAGVIQDVAALKTEELNQMNSVKPNRKKCLRPLIRSRTVPAIIVPVSLLQAQLVKTAPSKSGAPVRASVTHPSAKKDTQGKSDFSTPGVDFVQFLTGSAESSTSPCASSTTQHHHRNAAQGKQSHTSLESLRGSFDGSDLSSWNVLPSSSKILSYSDRSLSISSTDGHGSPFSYRTNVTPSHISVQSKALGRFARLLSTPAEDRRKSSTISLQPYHLSHCQPHQHKHQDSLGVPGVEPYRWLSLSPNPIRRRRSLEEEFGRPRSVSIDGVLQSNILQHQTNAKHVTVGKRLSTGSNYHPRMDYNRCNQDFLTAVETGNVEIVKAILDSSELNINRLNIDGFSLLSIAVIKKYTDVVKILLANGATESQHCKESIGEQLEIAVTDAEKKSQDLMAQLLKCSTLERFSSAHLKELENEFRFWDKQYKKFRKWQSDFVNIEPPEPPAVVNIDVISSTSVRIRLQDKDNQKYSLCTKYKVEWSEEEAFPPDSTKSMEMLDLRVLDTVLHGLNTEHRYYFRATAGNCKGYGMNTQSTPKSVVPSSWRDIAAKPSRYLGKVEILQNIFLEILRSRPESVSDINNSSFHRNDYQETGNELTQASDECIATPSSFNDHHAIPYQIATTQHQKKNQKIISIKQLFASAPKFQKHFKRGIFLSCVFYCEDKLLVTNEEFLPTIAIDETFPSSLHNDFHWLLKVSNTWEDVKSFKVDMEKSGSASTFHFRLKVLQAAAAMQSALGVVDLGRLYYKTTRDKENTIVIITTINYLRSKKLISSLNVRWIPLTKINNRKSSDDVSDVLVNSIQDQILYHQVSNIPVGRGLYLGYLKLASSVDLLQILVGEKTPNMLPHAKIRDNPHVSSEEWTMIQRAAKSESMDSVNKGEQNLLFTDEGVIISSERGQGGTSIGSEDTSNHNQENTNSMSEFTEAQQIFRNQIVAAVQQLFGQLEIDYENSKNHRLYNAEVVEVSNSVSLLIVMPALENVCLVAGQSDNLLQRNDLIPLPIQVFEMIHLSTYQKDFITRYARLSTTLEMDTILAQHTQREAFSSLEISKAKHRVNQLQDFQTKMDSAWKGSRWVFDVVTNCRDKSFTSTSVGVLVQQDLCTESSRISPSLYYFEQNQERQLRKSVIGSRSEQQLVVSSSIKLSLSESQLSQFGLPPAAQTQQLDSGDMSTNKGLQFNFGIPTVRKVSVPSPSEAAGAIMEAKLKFNPSIHSTYSQSDSTISQSTSMVANTTPSDHVSSCSLHNIHTQSCSSSPDPTFAKDMKNSRALDSDRTATHSLSSDKPEVKYKTPERGKPPPVPPRRTNPKSSYEVTDKPNYCGKICNESIIISNAKEIVSIPSVTIDVSDYSSETKDSTE